MTKEVKTMADYIPGWQPYNPKTAPKPPYSFKGYEIGHQPIDELNLATRRTQKDITEKLKELVK